MMASTIKVPCFNSSDARCISRNAKRLDNDGRPLGILCKYSRVFN